MPGAVRPRWRLVVVDDYQESTSATARLLRVLADDGARVLLLADPDAAVQTFRGATPSLVGRAGLRGPGPGELGARTIVLRTAWRHDAGLRSVVGRIAERVGAVGAVQHRRARARHGRATGTCGSPCCRAPRRRRRSWRTRCAARTSSAGCRGRRWPSSRGPAPR